MNVDIEQREEIKSIDTVKTKSSTMSMAANKSLEIGKALFYPAINTCLEKAPIAFNQVVHESIPEGKTCFQNYLMGELFPAKETWRSPRRVGILPVNQEVMKSIADYLSANRATQVQEIVDCYKKSINDFKEIRFSLVKRMFPNVEHEATGIGAAAEETKIEKQGSPKEDAYPIKVLKELILIIFEKCQSYCKELNKDLEESNHTSSYKTALNRYLSTWESFFLSALEINNHLAALNEVMNDASKILLPDLPAKIPKFAVWRLLVGAFKSFTYMPLRQNLQSGCLRLLKEFSLSYIAITAKAAKMKAEKMTEAEVMAFIKGETKNTKDYEEAAVTELTNDDIFLCFKVVESLIDMSLNELTVHFLGSKSLELKVCKDMCKPLSTQIKELCEEAMKKFGKTKELVALLGSELNLLKSIFPPCMWDDIEVTLRDSVMTCLKEEVGKKAEQFAAIPKEQKKTEAGPHQDRADDRHVVPVVQQLKNENGKPIFKQDEQKMFVDFLYNKHQSLYNQYVEQRIALNSAKNREQTIEDIEIDIKNKCLGIQFNEELNSFFMMGGINLAELGKITSK